MCGVGPKRKCVGPVVSGNMSAVSWAAEIAMPREKMQVTHWALPHSGVGSNVDFTRSTGKTKMDRF